MDMKELRKNAEKVIAERFPNFNFSTLDWGELDPFYLEHPEENQIYEEVGPLLSKIYKQNRQIKSQLEAARRNQEEFSIITENMQEGLLVIDSYTTPKWESWKTPPRGGRKTMWGERLNVDSSVTRKQCGQIDHIVFL